MGPLAHDEVLRWARVGVLAAFALVLGYLETFVPIPIPGVKLGLANIAVLLCFVRLDVPSAFFVTLIKVLAQGLLYGSPLTFAYSLTGSLAAFAVMAATVRIPGMHLAMASVLGAVSHTAGQMLVAAALLGTRFVWLAAPVLIVASIATGALCGVLAVRLGRALDAREGVERVGEPVLKLGELSDRASRPAGPILAVFAVFAVIVMLQHGIMPLAVLFTISAIACAVVRADAALLARGARTFAVIAIVSAATTAMSAPSGEALARIAVMALRLGSVMCASVAVMGLLGKDGLLAFTVRSAYRLESLGISMRGPLLALNVCLQAAPMLASGIGADGARLSGSAVIDAIADVYTQAEQLAAAICGDGGEGEM